MKRQQQTTSGAPSLLFRPRGLFALVLAASALFVVFQALLRTSHTGSAIASPRHADLPGGRARGHCEQGITNSSLVREWPTSCPADTPQCCLPTQWLLDSKKGAVHLKTACNEDKDSPYFEWIKRGESAPACCVTRLVAVFTAVTDMLERLELPYSLGMGTAMGAWRYAGLNPWDSTAVILYPASLDRAVYAAAVAVSRLSTVCGASGCSLSFPDAQGFFLSVSPGADTLGVHFMRVWRAGESSAKKGSWRDDVFLIGDKQVTPNKGAMKLSDLVPLARVPFYGRHLPAPVSQSWYKRHFLVDEPEGVVDVPASIVDDDMLRKHAPPERPASAFRWLMKRWLCSEDTLAMSNAVPQEDFAYNDFAYALKYSVGPELTFGDAPMGQEKTDE